MNTDVCIVYMRTYEVGWGPRTPREHESGRSKRKGSVEAEERGVRMVKPVEGEKIKSETERERERERVCVY